MTKTKKFIIGTLISVVTLGGLVTYASAGKHCGERGGMHGKKAEFMIKRISSKLDLNDAQKQKLEAVKTTMMEQMKSHQENHPKQKIKELLSAPKLDQEKAVSMVNERSEKMKQAAPKMIATIAEFTDSLNAEQRAEMQKMMEKFGKHRGKHFGKGGYGKDKQQAGEEASNQ